MSSPSLPARRLALAAAAALSLVMSLGLFAIGAGAQPAYDNAERVEAASFVEAGVAISREVFDLGAEAVVLATTANFPDALSSSALAASVLGPVLFTDRDSLPSATADEIDRLLSQGDTVYVMGGQAAVADSVLDDLRARGYNALRVSGPTRLETAAESARRTGAPAGTVLLARAFGGDPGSVEDRTNGWVDSISCGGYAAESGAPILLTETERLSETTAAVLDELAVTQVLICGGPAAVGDAVEAALVESGRTVNRYRGATRVETALEVARGLFEAPTAAGRNYILVNGYGENYGYGLAAAALSARDNAPILLTGTEEPTDCADETQPSRATLCYLETAGSEGASVVAVGSAATVGDAVLVAAAEAAGGQQTTGPTDSGSATATTSASATASGPLAVPAQVSVTDPNDDGTRIVVSWQEVTGASGYNVYYGTDGPTTKAGGTPTVSDADETTYEVTGLTKDTEYAFAVTAVGTGGRESEKSEPKTATPADEVPASVADFVARPGDGQVRLSWKPSSEPDVTGYRITRFDAGTAPGETCPTTDAVYGAEQTVNGRQTSSFTDTGRTNGNGYCYRIVAVDGAGQRSAAAQSTLVRPAGGIASVEVVAPAGNPPSQPEVLTYSAPYPIKWRVSDSDTPLNHLTIKIEYSTTGGVTYTHELFNGKHPSSTSGDGTFQWPVTLPEADADRTNNQIRITVIEPGNRFSDDTSPLFTTQRAPRRVTNANATPGNNQVTVKWDPAPETAVSGYEIRRTDVTVTNQSDTENACSSPFAGNEQLIPVTGRTTTTYVDQDAANSTTAGDIRYCYQVRALRPGDDPDGPFSVTASANPSGNQPGVVLVRPGNGAQIVEGQPYTIEYNVAVPAAATADRVLIDYCYNYNAGVPNVSPPSCNSAEGWQAITTVKPVTAGNGKTYTWAVPSIPQGNNQNGAVRARIYATADQADTSPSTTSTNSGIVFR